MSGPGQSPQSKYAVNNKTGEVAQLTPDGWVAMKTARNDRGDVLVFENGGWKPVPNMAGDPAMTAASKRANAAFSSGQPISQDDIAQLGKLDFSPAAMARLPAPTQTPEELDALDAQRRLEKEQARVPDNDLAERLVIGLNVPTFGNGPRFAAGVSTLGALAATPLVEGDIIDREGVSGATTQFLDDARVHQRRAREERPIESFGTELVGGLAQGKTLIDTAGKKLVPMTTTAGNVLRTMLVGGGYGATYGASQNESGTLEGVGQDAAVGAALGATVGAGLKALQAPATVGVRKTKEVGASIYDALNSLIGRQTGARDRVAEDVAIAAVRRSMERSGLTLQQVMDLVQKYEGKPAVLAEVLGQDAINALTALTRRPGSTPQKAQAIIEERTYGRPDRMKGDVEDATGIPIGQLDNTLETQLTERQKAAKPLYDELYKRFSTTESFRQPGQTGQVMKRINRLARTPLAQRHLQLAKDAVSTIAARRGIPVSKMSRMEYWDLVKRSLDDAIDAAKAKGENRTRVGEGIDDLVGLKNDIVTELDRLTNGAYAAAREAGGEAPRLKAAAEAGQKALAARNPRDVAKTVAETNPQDLPALRAGVVEDLGTRIDGKGMAGPMRPQVVRVPSVAGKLRAALGDEAGGKLIGRLDAEATLSDTGARWAPRMNSVTGTVMESGPTALGDDLVNAGMNLATGNKLGLFRQAINWMRQRGFSQRQIDAIGDLLLSSPEEGLQRLKLMAPEGVPAGPTNGLNAALNGDKPPPSGGGSGSKNGFNQIMSKGKVVEGEDFSAARAAGKLTPEERAVLLGDDDIKAGGVAFGRPRVNVRRETRSEVFSDDRLTPTQNKAVELRRNGFTRQEIADEMAVSVETVDSYVSKAKALGIDVGDLAKDRIRDDILALAQKGLRHNEIGKRLGITVNNVKQVIFQARRAAGEDVPAWLAPRKPGRPVGGGFAPAVRGDLGAALTGALGGGIVPIPAEEGDTFTDTLTKRAQVMGMAAAAAVAARRGVALKGGRKLADVTTQGFGPKDLGNAAKAAGNLITKPIRDAASAGKYALTQTVKASGADASGPRMGRMPGDPSQIEVPKTPATVQRTAAKPVPDLRPKPPAPRTIDEAITQKTSRIIAGLRARFAPLDDPRQYGPRMASYEPPARLDPERPLYDQVNNPRLAAQDIAEGSDDAARRGLDYVNEQRVARMAADETNAARAGGLSEKNRATRELKAARAEVDAFYGTQAEHRGFKGKAKKAEEARRLKRLRDAAEAWRQTREIPVPGKAEIPSERDQIIYQEITRRSPRDGMSPRARELERRALSMLLDPEMSTAGAYAAKAAPDGFKPSDQLARNVGYTALVGAGAATVGGGVAAVNAMAETERKAEEAAKAHMDQRAAWPADKPKPKSEWGELSREERMILQSTLNAINDRQITVDGGLGPKTEDAIREAQAKLGLPVSGVLDRATRKALNEQTELRMYRYREQLKAQDPSAPSPAPR